MCGIAGIINNFSNIEEAKNKISNVFNYDEVFMSSGHG